ncbi:MAG: hypothetical protein K0R26_340 [Bacteroidota bacterium]|jgi:hypothetical protein|nr:hypothetical protein [Bacteroidota bacterium]
MNYFWIFCVTIAFHLSVTQPLKAQNDTMLLHQVYPGFSDSEKAEWTSFENNWNYFDYSDIQKSLKIPRLSCKRCGSLYADLYIEIDAQGKIALVRFLQGKKCGVLNSDVEFVKLFENSLSKQIFGTLKNKKFIVRLGHILKC